MEFRVNTRLTQRKQNAHHSFLEIWESPHGGEGFVANLIDVRVGKQNEVEPSGSAARGRIHID